MKLELRLYHCTTVLATLTFDYYSLYTFTLLATLYLAKYNTADPFSGCCSITWRWDVTLGKARYIASKAK